MVLKVWILILTPCIYTSDKYVIDFNMYHATIETPLTTVILKFDQRHSTKLEEKYDKHVGIQKTSRCASGEVIPEVVMFTAEEAPASFIQKDIETETGVN